MKWLRELVDIDVSVEDLAERLDLSGTKVETVHKPIDGVEGIVVAEVLAIEPHPNADNLVLVDVSSGAGTTEHVVCGARNFAVGDRVPYATVGARLPGMTISERRIRGEVSRGMLCSAAELAIAKDHSGILVLPPDAEVGQDVAALLGLDDTIIELEITTNRPDCMGMIGIAREVAALLGSPLHLPPSDVESTPTTGDVVVSIEDARGCPRYLARVVDGVSVSASPAWLTRRLLAAGVRPISNVVDVTNYVMLETAQPLHAFDASKLNGGRIVVRRARPAESLVTLDGVDRRLHPEDLVIADAERAVALAGVMGGAHSEVGPETSTVVLESAHFEHGTVAWTSRRHLLRTEASARFERGADPNGVDYAAARAARLLGELAGGKAGEAVDVYPERIQPRVLTLRPARTDAVLGAATPKEEQAALLRSIELGVTEGADVLEVRIPTFRPDLEREADLVEEVGRLAGYQRLPSTVPSGPAGGLDPIQTAERRFRRALTGLGVDEAWTNSFMSPRQLDDLGLPSDDPRRSLVELVNPTSEEEPALRTTLLPNLLRSAAHNLARRAPGVGLFEIARVYLPSGGELADEPTHLGAVFSGRRDPGHWRAPAQAWDFFGAKGVLEAAAKAMRLGSLDFAPTSGPPWHPTRAAAIELRGRRAGEIGELHPDVCAGFDVPNGTVAFEVDLRVLLDELPDRPRVGELGRFPSLFIDLAVVVDETTEAASVERVIARAGAPDVASLALFDVYRGEQVASGSKSLAYALELRSQERTLTDDDAAALRDRVLDALSREVGAELRR